MIFQEHRENRNQVDPPKFKEAVELFKTELAGDSTMKPRSNQELSRFLAR